ncbi:uncharacterized protein LOC127773136 [Oryza glaberrima]|uniref:Uncharacterized protein n=1 Tax=Oryza glaberrima TaxID=4538 RepID=I1PVY5_ORYGL|nr:uncharacterized protein LOC127773136 [Oryza glaberrima]
METGVFVVSAVVGLFAVASAVLGFIAEEKKLTPEDIDVSSGECEYPANAAFVLGICAVLLLAVAQIIVSSVAGCCGCCRPRAGASESRRVTGIVCSVFSWIAAIVAGVSFVQGAAWNAPVTRDTAPLCYYLKDGVFRRAAVLSLAAAVFGIKSYIMLRAATAVEPKPDGQQPQPQQAPAAPVVTGYPPQGYAPNQQFTAAADQVYGQGPSALYPPTKGYGQV